MYELQKLREEIDVIDEQLFKLLEQRMELSLKVKEAKKKTSKAVLDTKREEEIKAKILAYPCSEIFKEKLLAIYQTIFISSKQLQNDID